MPPPLPAGHDNNVQVVVTWKDLTIIWIRGSVLFGGKKQGVLYCHKDGKWIPKITFGDAPSYRYGAGAQVHNDIMYLMCGMSSSDDYSNDIHALDLNSWTWRKLNPQGSPPTQCAYLSTWLHKGKIYGFGGETSEYPQDCSNQFFSYHVARNCWEWPSVHGKIPTQRSFHTTFICGNTAILFGGAQNTVAEVMNDLHTLNMVNLTWTQVHSSLAGEGLPEPRAGHSMTQVSSRAAVLFGGFYPPKPPSKDCWLLNITKVLEGDFDKPSSLWERCQQHENELPSRIASRMLHSAVIEPITKRLWVLGGLIQPIPSTTTKVLSLTFNSGTPLKFLAMERAARYFGPDHLKLKPTDLPRHLKIELENHFQYNSFKCHIKGCHGCCAKTVCYGGDLCPGRN